MGAALGWIDAANAWILQAAAGPHALIALGISALVDGIFPPAPTDLIVLGLALGRSHGAGPSLWAATVVTTIASLAGDLLAYGVGRAVPWETLPVLRAQRGRRAAKWAHRAFEVRGGLYMVASRFVPGGRVVVNLAAGSARYGIVPFCGYSALSGAVWTVYMWGIGALSARWLLGHPLAVVVVGAAIGIVIGLLADRAVLAWSRR